MNFTRGKRRRAPSVIIVSLIDVLLVVLIFLMVTTTFKKLEPALELALPQAKVAKAAPADKTAFTVQVATNFPYFYVENQPLGIDELEKQIQAAVVQKPGLKISIQADRQAPFGEVVKVIDLAKQSNAGSIEAVMEKAGP